MKKIKRARAINILIAVYFFALFLAVLLESGEAADFEIVQPALLSLFVATLFLLILEVRSGFYRLIFVVFIFSRVLDIITDGGAAATIYDLDVIGFVFLAIAYVKRIVKRPPPDRTRKTLLTALVFLLLIPPFFKFFENPYLQAASVYAHFFILASSIHLMLLPAREDVDLHRSLKALALISGGIVVVESLQTIL